MYMYIHIYIYIYIYAHSIHVYINISSSSLGSRSAESGMVSSCLTLDFNAPLAKMADYQYCKHARYPCFLEERNIGNSGYPPRGCQRCTHYVVTLRGCCALCVCCKCISEVGNVRLLKEVTSVRGDTETERIQSKALEMVVDHWAPKTKRKQNTEPLSPLCLLSDSEESG